MNFHEKSEEFISDRRNINHVVDLVNALDPSELNVTDNVKALEDLFIFIIKRGDFFVNPELRVTNPKAFDVEMQYVDALIKLFDATWLKILSLIDGPNKSLQEQSFVTLLTFISAEKKDRGFPENFSAIKLQKMLTVLLGASNIHSNTLDKFADFMKYQDIYFYTWKSLREVINTLEDCDTATQNLLKLLDKMSPAKSIDPNDGQLFSFTDPSKFPNKEDELRKIIQKIWTKLVNRRLNAMNHRKLLLILLEKYLSYLKKPHLLIDFLTGSLSVGGVVGLLALQGVSTLVIKHNLECPNIFEKLYNMFELEILHSKYKTRLFYLADLFLQSTHISEQLVAAFIKRLSRLSLTAQTPDLVLILRFVGNLLIRHPGLTFMKQHPDGGAVDFDPYDMSETDPLKSRAIESSLWELALLKNHIQPKVSSAARFLDFPLPTIEWDIRDVLEGSYEKMFESEIKKNPKAEPSLTFMRPTTLTQLADDRVYKLWSLT